MANDNPEGLSLRKRLAQGVDLPSGDFGVDKLNSKAAGGPKSSSGTLSDSERGAGPPVGHNQANPNHGYE